MTEVTLEYLASFGPSLEDMYPPRRRAWNAAMDQFARLNRLRNFHPGFTARMLATGGKRSCWKGVGAELCASRGAYLWDEDHRASAAVIEVPLTVFCTLRDYVIEHGLTVQMPPNPFASLWSPGRVLFCVLTMRDREPLSWLPAQMQFSTLKLAEVA